MSTKTRRRSITLKDVAREAGVSVGTASNAINRQSIVSKELRERVETVIERLGYHPSALARSIKRNRTMVIGLVIPKIRNAFYIQVIDAVEKLVRGHGYTLVLANSDEDIDAELAHLKSFSAGRVDGLILASAGRKDLARIGRTLATFDRLGIPVVLIVRELDDLPYDTIVLDNEAGAYRATRHALEHGHRRIAIISSQPHTSASRQRIQGYRRALSEHGIAVDPELVHVGGVAPDSGHIITDRLLGLAARPTMIFVATNFLLIGCLKAIHEHALRIPDDISLICFDDPEWSPYLNPPLTAIRPNSDELCRMAVRFLLDRIDGSEEGAPRLHVVPADLVIRDSVASL